MMLHKKTCVMLSTLLLIQFATVFSWDYLQQKSWPDTCISGTRQSPINLANSGIPCTKHNVFSLTFQQSSVFQFKLANNTWAATSDTPIAHLLAQDISGTVQKYESKSFAIHSKSEHAMSSQRYDLEFQIFFALSPESPNHTPDSKAIISVLFQKDPTYVDSALISTINNAISSTYETGNIILDFNELIGNNLTNHTDFLMYKGSNTVPPCTEDVNWYVLESPLRISESDMQFIKGTFFDESKGFSQQTGNARDLQDLNSRMIQRLCDVTAFNDQPLSNGVLITALSLILLFLGLYFTYGRKVQGGEESAFTGNNLWTLHPIYSITSVPPKDDFQRRGRISILFTSWLTQLTSASLWYSTYQYNTSMDVLLVAIFAVISTIPINFFLGLLCRRYYRRVRELSSKAPSNASLSRSEKLVFLAICLGIMVVDLLLIYSHVDMLIGKLSRHSVYSFFAAVFLEECIIEPTLIYLASKFNIILPILKLRGYYFEGENTHYIQYGQ